MTEHSKKFTPISHQEKSLSQENTLIILPKMLHQGEQSAKSLRSNTPSQSTSLTPRQLFYKVKDDIRAISKDQELTYDNIQPAVGQLVAASLDEDSDVEARSIRLNYYSITQQLIITMPTWVHDSHSSWVKTELGFALRQGFFSDEEWETMKFSVGTGKFSPIKS